MIEFYGIQQFGQFQYMVFMVVGDEYMVQFVLFDVEVIKVYLCFFFVINYK